MAEASALRLSAINFLREMQCNPENLLAETCKKLELLQIKPFDQAAISFADGGSFMQAPAPSPVLHGLFEAAHTGNYAPLFAPIPAVPCGGARAGTVPPLPSAPPAAFSDSEGSSEGSGGPSKKNADTLWT